MSLCPTSLRPCSGGFATRWSKGELFETLMLKRVSRTPATERGVRGCNYTQSPFRPGIAGQHGNKVSPLGTSPADQRPEVGLASG